MFEMIHDLRASIRSLRHRPLYALVAVGILALGLSAGIAVFTYVNGFYQPFPGVNTDGLVRVFAAEEENPYRNISYPDYEDYAAEATETFEGIAAIQASFAASVRLETAADVVFGQALTGNELRDRRGRARRQGVAAALLATYLPARRAVAVDPVTSLRSE